MRGQGTRRTVDPLTTNTDKRTTWERKRINKCNAVKSQTFRFRVYVSDTGNVEWSEATDSFTCEFKEWLSSGKGQKFASPWPEPIQIPAGLTSQWRGRGFCDQRLLQVQHSWAHDLTSVPCVQWREAGWWTVTGPLERLCGKFPPKNVLCEDWNQIYNGGRPRKVRFRFYKDKLDFRSNWPDFRATSLCSGCINLATAVFNMFMMTKESHQLRTYR